MRHLLSGVAAAAMLTAAAAWAQAPMSPSAPGGAPAAAQPAPGTPPAPAAPKATAPAAPGAAPVGTATAARPHRGPVHRRVVRRHYYRYGAPYGYGGYGNHVANQLNAEELQRTGMGPGAEAPAGYGAPPGYGPPPGYPPPGYGPVPWGYPPFAPPPWGYPPPQ